MRIDQETTIFERAPQQARTTIKMQLKERFWAVRFEPRYNECVTHWERAIDLRFHGPRFADGALDVDVMSEVIAYKSLVESVAEALWRTKHPERVRLDKGFGSSFGLRMVGLAKGSALTVLERSRASSQGTLPTVAGDYFDDSMGLISEAIDLVSKQRALPNRFPRNQVRRFGLLGKRLESSDWIEIARPGQTGVRFDGERRSQLLGLVESQYEDSADEVGYVLATSVRKGRFELYESLDSSAPVEVPLDDAFEPLVLERARDYQHARVRVRGRGAFDAAGSLLRFVSVDSIVPYGADESGEIDNTSLFAALHSISDAISEEDARKLPSDASVNLDVYLRKGIR